MSTFALETIPAGVRVPGSQVEFSNVRALGGLPAAAHKILLIGQRTNAGAVAQLIPRRITQADQGAAFFGRGSMLAAMVAAAILANPVTELWAVGIDDNIAGTAAVQTITVTGAATANGTLALMIAGQPVNVAVTAGDAVATVATAIATAVTGAADLPVTGAAAAGVVTLTARHKGTAGNDIDARVNYYDGQALPAGIAVTFASTVAGAGDPDLTTVFAALGDEQYQAIALGIANAANLTAADVELTSRWGPGRQKEGRAYAAFSGTLSACATFGATRNGIHTTIVGSYKLPTPPWRVAAAIAAVAGYHLQIDPARPLTDLTVPGVIAPRVEHRFRRDERDQLLKSGISTLRVLPGDVVAIERLISTYQVNALGFPDVSYLDVTTTATLGYFRYSWRQRMAQKFARAKLTQTTISAVRAETIAIAREWGEAELMEDVDGFLAGLVIERDSTSPTQLNVLMTPNTVNGLLQLAARIEFVL